MYQIKKIYCPPTSIVYQLMSIENETSCPLTWLDLFAFVPGSRYTNRHIHTHTHCRLIVHQSNCIQLSSVSVNESAIGTCHFCQVVMRWCAAAYFTCWSGLPVDVKVFSLPSFLPSFHFILNLVRSHSLLISLTWYNIRHILFVFVTNCVFVCATKWNVHLVIVPSKTQLHIWSWWWWWCIKSYEAWPWAHMWLIIENQMCLTLYRWQFNTPICLICHIFFAGKLYVESISSFGTKKLGIQLVYIFAI